ncbi:conserved uncharacterized protein [Stigmatella aurantiaca DW4/3-1]|uniref:Conserved uncharacterized protein n=1 Tax=Stigmatella aurantiaca (strain DW4/3-1) TaxID=378806 RepID=E3FJL1_STIAD|nr:conserved uncharacterized protein [Stigmatella aurantiaca DW4/3-1]
MGSAGSILIQTSGSRHASCSRGHPMERALAEHIAHARYEALDASVIESTKSFILDTLGVSLAGLCMPGIQPLLAYVLQQGGRGESTILGHRARGTAEQAALINGALAHVLDYDETHVAANVHANAAVFPAALAVAEQQGQVSGREFLVAIALGVDLTCRLGIACRQGMSEGWWPTSLFGAFGAAAATARLLGLDVDRIRQTLGIAYAQATGNRQAMLDGGDAKYLQCGLAARSAVTAGHFARMGFTGATHFLSGPFGLSALYAGGALREAALFEGLGRRFLGAELTCKLYPCCSAAQAPLHAALELMRDHPIDARSLAEIRVQAPREVAEQLGRPDQEGSTRIQLQVNLPYLVAAAVVRGRLSLQDLEEDALHGSPEVLWLAKRVTVEAASTSSLRGAELPVTVEFIARDGTRWQRTVDAPAGAPSYMGRREQILDKFRSCLGHGGDETLRARSGLIIERLFHLESLDSMDRLTEAFRTRSEE